MRHTTLACLALALAFAMPLAAQTKDKEKKPAAKPKTISLSGCVVVSEKTPRQFTLADLTDGGTYRLTGINMADYVGQRVQIGGSLPDSKRLVIKGGLTPSANVAAQAGNMDPARAATKGADGTTVNGTGTPEFRVRSIKPTQGSCTQ